MQFCEEIVGVDACFERFVLDGTSSSSLALALAREGVALFEGIDHVVEHSLLVLAGGVDVCRGTAGLLALTLSSLLLLDGLLSLLARLSCCNALMVLLQCRLKKKTRGVNKLQCVHTKTIYHEELRKGRDNLEKVFGCHLARIFTKQHDHFADRVVHALVLAIEFLDLLLRVVQEVGEFFVEQIILR